MTDKPIFIADGHLDLAFTALHANRDLTQPAATVRTHDSPKVMQTYGTSTTTFHELHKGHVGLVIATATARLAPKDNWTRIGMYTQAQCYGVACSHAAYYHAMERERVIRIVRSVQDLDEVLANWEDPVPDTPIGLVLALEGCDPILGPDQVPEWYDKGLRVASLSHYGVTSYAHGSGTEGGLLPPAKPLLDAFSEFGIIVDLSHLTDQSYWELLDTYDGPVLASHCNCRALVPDQRQLSDDMLKAVIERGGVIGSAFDSWMLDTEWKHTAAPYHQISNATLETVADHIDHVCEVAGNARHAGLGTDVDAGFGTEQTPRDFNTSPDLQKFRGIFERRGYSEEDVRNILSGNWIRLLREVWSNRAS